MKKSDADHNDASLILKLYDLRRETVMRDARRFMMQADFSSTDSVLALASNFEDPNNAYFRQVVSYWEMAASFVLHGVLSPELFADNCGEGLVTYLKLEAHIPALREAMFPMFFQKTERLLAEHEVIRLKLESLREMFARIKSRG